MTSDEDEHDRCLIWDSLYNDGPRYPSELQRILGIHQVRIGRLTEHPWFWKLDGQVRIAHAQQKHPAIKTA
jgi:hypothetical protein